MVRNFKMIVSYDGTRYFGWEHQQETDLTIQGRLETVLTRMVERDPDQPVTVIGAGRTDAGVHARAMTCNVLLNTDKSFPSLLLRLSEVPHTGFNLTYKTVVHKDHSTVKFRVLINENTVIPFIRYFVFSLFCNLIEVTISVHYIDCIFKHILY